LALFNLVEKNNPKLKNTMKTNQNLAYVRVSTELQEASLDAQRTKILDYCKFKGLDEPEFIIDEDVSGGKPLFSRPEGSKLELVKNTNILCVKLDRLFRNTVDSLLTKDTWERNKNIIHLVDEDGVSINTDSAIGRLIYTMRSAMGEWERGVISERTKAVLNDKKDKGRVYSRPIFGFDQTEDGEMVENEEEMRWVDQIYYWKNIERRPLQYIADLLNEKGIAPKGNGKIFYPSTLKYILDNPIYKQVAV